MTDATIIWAVTAISAVAIFHIWTSRLGKPAANGWRKVAQSLIATTDYHRAS